MDKNTFKRVSRIVNSKLEHKILIMYMGVGKDSKRFSIADIARYLKHDEDYISFLLGKAFSNFTYGVIGAVTPDMCLREVDRMDKEISNSLFGGYVMGVSKRLSLADPSKLEDLKDALGFEVASLDWI